MNAATFAAQLARYPVIRPRDFCARDVGTCPVPRAAAAAGGTRASAAAAPSSSAAVAAAAASAPASAPAALASAPAAPAVEFWSGLNALLASAAPGDRAAQRAAVSAFETLHFSLLRESSLEEVEEALAAVAQTEAGAPPALAPASALAAAAPASAEAAPR